MAMVLPGTATVPPGMATVTSTITLLDLPVQDAGAVEVWAVAGEAFTWVVNGVGPADDGEILLFSRNPATLTHYDEFEAQPRGSFALPADVVDASVHGSGTFVLTSAPARIGKVGVYANGSSYAAPESWLELPAGAVDFEAYGGELHFIVVSETEGLYVLRPVAQP